MALIDTAMQIGAESNIRLRSYQTEMLHASLEKNIIVAMETGSGKTHIAIARIRAELERTQSDKLVWFLAPSKTLAEQQYKAIAADLSGYGVRLLTGADGVEKWTDFRLWDAVLTSIRVVVATPAVLKDALEHVFVEFSRLSLLVFDEAHHASKNHPMNAIMKLFYHPARLRGEPVPAVLGLSASPVMNTKQGGLQVIESNLCALAVTPKQHRAELETFVHPPELVIVTYRDTSLVNNITRDPLRDSLATATHRYDLSQDPYIIQLKQQDDERSKKELTKRMLDRKTYCNNQLRALDNRAEAIAEQLGDTMSRWYIETSIARFRKGFASGESFLPDLSELERKHLGNIFDRIEQQAPQTNVPAAGRVSHKADELIKFLAKSFDADTRGIVFVEQRVQVTALAELLRQTPEVSNNYKTGSFVGTSVSSNRKISVADLVALSDQQADLEAFRLGQKNLMVATTVLEEGIDVSACNLVICFDLPKNLVSYVQRKGRARSSHSKLVLFMSQEEIDKGVKPWAILEAEMKKLYMDDTRELNEVSEVDVSDRVYQVPSTKALLTIDDAKSHLHHFCSVSTLQSGGYADLRPEFDTSQDLLTGLWSATVDLPAFVHPDFRHARSAEQWRYEPDAIKDAAFEAYIALHKAGLVNDHLLPLIRDYGPEVGQEHVDQPSLVEVSSRMSMFNRAPEAPDSQTTWSPCTVKVSLQAETIAEMNVWIPQRTMVQLEPFDLFWNEDITYTVSLASRTSRSIEDAGGSSPDTGMLRKATSLLLSSVHSSRMDGTRDDFAILLSPAGIDNLAAWLKMVDGMEPVSMVALPLTPDCGLVRTPGQLGRAFFFETMQDDKVEAGKQITVRSFPKRRDFLHKIAEGSSLSTAHTAMMTFDPADCTVDRLPARYSLFAAFVPSILHRIDIALLSHRLAHTILEGIDFGDTSLLTRCLTSPAAGEPYDYNRLEYLGDCILKHCTELQVMAQHVYWPESYLTLERDRIVRNSNLARAALELGLDRYIIVKPFTGTKWRPPYTRDLQEAEAEKRTMSTKVLADVVEALIGAAYQNSGLENGRRCIETLLPQETWLHPSDCFDLLIQELRPTNTTNISLLEKLIGHKFQHPTLLVEAVTHVSFADIRTGMSYERLEYLGDSVLDMIITPKLFAHARKLKHWQLHRYHEALVNSHFLGYCCLRYCIEEEQFHIIDTTGSGRTFATEKSSRRVHLYDFLRAGNQINLAKRTCIAHFNALNENIHSALMKSKNYPWLDLISLSPPKFFCDLIESLLGALYISTRGNLALCETFVQRLGILEYMTRLLDGEVECLSPKERMGIVADREECRYVNERYEDGEGRKVWRCRLMVGGGEEEEEVVVEGCGSRDEAEARAAWEGWKVLEGRGGRLGRKRKFAGMRDDVGVDGDVLV